jgi:hypothetical protein
MLCEAQCCPFLNDGAFAFPDHEEDHVLHVCKIHRIVFGYLQSRVGVWLAMTQTTTSTEHKIRLFLLIACFRSAISYFLQDCDWIMAYNAETNDIVARLVELQSETEKQECLCQYRGCNELSRGPMTPWQGKIYHGADGRLQFCDFHKSEMQTIYDGYKGLEDKYNLGSQHPEWCTSAKTHLYALMEVMYSRSRFTSKLQLFSRMHQQVGHRFWLNHLAKRFYMCVEALACNQFIVIPCAS